MSDPSRQRVLVTGAAGFIGFHIVSRLLSDGACVHGVDNLNTYYDVRLKQARLAAISPRDLFSFRQLDVTDWSGLASEFQTFRPHCVIHLAAQSGVRHSTTDPRAYVANLDGFLAVLEACRAHPVRHLIYASSSSVYGARGELPFHEDDPANKPLSLYAATKRANELVADSYAHLYGIPCTGLRFFTVYGPWGRPDMAYYSFTRSIVEGRPIELFGEGRMRRDFTYVGDVAEAIERLVELPPSSALASPSTPHVIYNIGNHSPIELRSFVGVLEAALGRKATVHYLPSEPTDMAYTHADVGRLSRTIGFAPRTTIEYGIAEFVAWFREYHAAH